MCTSPFIHKPCRNECSPSLFWGGFSDFEKCAYEICVHTSPLQKVTELNPGCAKLMPSTSPQGILARGAGNSQSLLLSILHKYLLCKSQISTSLTFQTFSCDSHSDFQSLLYLFIQHLEKQTRNCVFLSCMDY